MRWTSGIFHVNRVVLASVHNTCTIRRERWQLRLNKLESNRLFEGLDAKNDDPLKQHDDDVKEASVVSSTSFAPATDDGKMGPSCVGPIYLTSYDE